MQILDIHSHILPGVDDGAKDIASSIELLKMMRDQGITAVVATPHFYASEDNLEEFTTQINSSYNRLKAAIDGIGLPEIYLGAEVYYFRGIRRSSSIRSLCIEGTNYLLLELPYRAIDNSTIEDIVEIHSNYNIIPIIAHIERYYKEKGFKQLLELVKDGVVYAQVNAASLLQPPFSKIIQKLMKKGYISFIATDAHSPEMRPPFMDLALKEVERLFGKDDKDVYVSNSSMLLKAIKGEYDEE